ncbi:MAG: 3'-5' exoribonuclease domain-containing protein [Alphaproteobacteria bacterium]
MKYWFDTEFIDDTKTIDLISIGIIDEEGKTYYAISNEFDINKACPWVKRNVLPFLTEASKWKSRETIKKEIVGFIDHRKPEFWVYNGAYDWVVFCQLFGHIRDLPRNYPWYANDIKQLAHSLGTASLPEHSTQKHNALEDAKWTKLAWEFLTNYKKYSTST